MPEPGQLPLLMAACGVMIVVGLVVRRYPRLGMVLWLVTIGFVPVWMGVSIKLYWMPATLVGVLVLVFIARTKNLRLGLPDLILGAFFVSCLAPLAIGGSTLSTVFVALTNWMLPFLLGRLLPYVVGLRWLHGAVAVVFTLVAIGLLIESVTHWNPFVTFMARPGGLYDSWGSIQIRGGHARAEGAFGHSIAAGSAVAMAMPLALNSRFRPWLRVLMVLLMGAGVVVTLSRVSMIGAALGVALVVLLLRGIPVRMRVGLAVAGGVLIAALSPFVREVLQLAGDEAANSASYRTWLVELVPHISVLGFSPLGSRSPDGTLYFGGFKSIDSQLIYAGLLYGWFALGIGLIALAAAVLVTLARRATPATIAIVAQLPALLTVALITQYADFFWFVAGVAVYSQVTARQALAPSATQRSRRTRAMAGIAKMRDTQERPRMTVRSASQHSTDPSGRGSLKADLSVRTSVADIRGDI